MLYSRRILLGVTGGIAAYKAAELTRLLRRAGAEVQVVMTAAATQFVGELTFQALSGRPVRVELFDPAHEAAMGHIELARWADLVLVAPASADFLARLASGRADDLLSTLCLATSAPVAVAPAMNRLMWSNPATQANLAILDDRGVHRWGPAEGDQACGESGPGRMLEPAELLDHTTSRLGGGPLAGVRALVTAGPTREPLDPVRFLGNRSSGKMGFAVAEALAVAGAHVTLVSGPVALGAPPGVTRVDVETASQMQAAVAERVAGCDLFVATAAVADYRPANVATEKIKKASADIEVRMVRNPDILAEVAARPGAPFTVGFAAETADVEAYAQAKLEAKGLDLIAANFVGEGAAFDRDDNALTLLWRGGGRLQLPRTDKGTLARELVRTITERFHARTATQDPG
jgi:phosphopantothenoylcysteine decarboxylase/phosphopantothenate--cysteine ligase